MFWRKKNTLRRAEVEKAASHKATQQAIKSTQPVDRAARALMKAVEDNHIVILIRRATTNG